MLGGWKFLLLVWVGKCCLMCTGPTGAVRDRFLGVDDIYLGHLGCYSILAISMARSKNVGKGKASSSPMGQAVKKRKSDASQPVKKGKGKRIASSSESESNDDDEIEAMFAEDSESDQEKWARSIANRGFHCKRGVKLETFLYSHPIRGIIQENRICTSCFVFFLINNSHNSIHVLKSWIFDTWHYLGRLFPSSL